MEEVAKYVLNPDTAHVEKIKNGIARKKEKFGEGYCPCVLPKFHSDKTVCACEEYRTTGVCHCGLYIE